MASWADYDSDFEDLLFLEEDYATNPGRVRRIHSVQGNGVVADCFSSDRRCMDMVRMPRRTLRSLIVKFVHEYGFRTNGHVMSVEEQVIITLHYFAHAGTFSAFGTVYGHSKNGIGKVVERLLGPMGRLFMDEMIPTDQSVVHRKFTTSPRWQAFQDCIGAIDGTHVNVYPPKHIEGTWHGRWKHATTNCLGICDHDMMFTYFFVGAQGSMHDARVLEEARSKPEFSFPNPLLGKYYLGDSGYTNQAGYLTPFRGTRYHPHQFERQRPSNKEELFNRQHSSLRSVIERTFGIWKNKWHIVLYSGALEGFELHKQLAIIRATVGLHNFVRRNKTADEVEEEQNPVQALDSQVPVQPLDFQLPVPVEQENEAGRRVDRGMDAFRMSLAEYIFELQHARN